MEDALPKHNTCGDSRLNEGAEQTDPLCVFYLPARLLKLSFWVLGLGWRLGNAGECWGMVELILQCTIGFSA